MNKKFYLILLIVVMTISCDKDPAFAPPSTNALPNTISTKHNATVVGFSECGNPNYNVYVVLFDDTVQNLPNFTSTYYYNIINFPQQLEIVGKRVCVDFRARATAAESIRCTTEGPGWPAAFAISVKE